MKRLIIICTLLLTFTFVNAQFSIGLTGGIGHSWLHHNEQPGVENEFHLGYHGGVSFLYSFASPVAISADLRFSAEGGKYNYNSSGNNILTKYRTHYLRVPVMVNYFFGDNGNTVRPKVAVGPSFGFLVGGKHELVVNGAPNYSEQAEKLFERSDVGVSGVVGLVFKLSPSLLMSTDVNYYSGFSNVNKVDPELKNRTIAFNLGFMVPLGGSTKTTTTNGN